MKEATDEHGFPRMMLFWHNQNSVIHSEEWLVPPAFGVPNADLSVPRLRDPCESVAQVLKLIFLSKACPPSVKLSEKADLQYLWDGCEAKSINNTVLSLLFLE